MDSTDGPVRRSSQNHRLSRRSSRSLYDQGEPRHLEECAHSDTPTFRRDRLGAPRKLISWIRFRRAIPAATSIIGGSARAPRCIIRLLSKVACYRLAIRMLLREI